MMNDQHRNKDFPNDSQKIEEKSFESFQSSRSSIIIEEKQDKDLNITPNSSIRHHSSNSYSNSQIDNIIASTEQSLNYFQELEQPGNKPIKFHLQKLYNLNREAHQLNKDYEKLKRSKSFEEKTLNTFNQRDIEEKKNFHYSYNYTSNLTGLNDLIEDFFKKTINQHQSLKYLRTMSINHITKTYTMPTIKEETNASLESLYTSLGHETYTKLIRIFEKYSLYGRTHTNLTLDYSQFTAFLTANKIYNEILTKSQAELIYNKVRSNSKSINFEEFVLILIQFSKLTFDWETNSQRSLTYFVNKYIMNIQCLQKCEDEKNMERFYFFLENKDFKNEVSKHLSHLFKTFLKYKVKDLKVGDFTNTSNFLKMCKDLEIVPVFLSSKEIINNINFVKYRKRNFTPTPYLDFCSFVEVICIIALRAFNKYLNEQTKRSFFEHVEKLRIFLNHIKEKSS